MSNKHTVVIFFMVTVGLLNHQSAVAQSDARRYEAGFVVTTIRQNDDFFQIVEGFEPRIRHNFGYGGRFTFNATDYLSIEGEITYHPKERFLIIGGLFPPTNTGTFIGGRRTEGLFGVKVGKRFNRFGIFAKARPGFMRFSEVPNCPDGDANRCETGGKYSFALDLGGVIEYYPAHNLVIRFDIGDTIIKNGKLTRAAFVGTPSAIFPLKIGGGTTNNAQYSIGISFRF